MNRKELGEDAYSALVDIRAELENQNNIILSLVLHKVMNMPSDERRSFISQTEFGLANRQMPSDARNADERQYLIDLSQAIETKAHEYARNLRLLVSRAEAMKADDVSGESERNAKD